MEWNPLTFPEQFRHLITEVGVHDGGRPWSRWPIQHGPTCETRTGTASQLRAWMQANSSPRQRYGILFLAPADGNATPKEKEKNMPEPERYEVLVLGSGEGGKYLAWHMAKSGNRTAVMERKWIGGSCPNINCLPSKNEIWSAKVADLVHHAAKFGMVTGSTAIDMARVRQRKRDMVEGLVAMHLDKYKGSGAELIMGTGRFLAPKTLEVRLNDGGTRVLAGEQVFLNVGTHAAIPSVPGLEAARPLTHIEALELDYLPPHLIVLGGGYVGLELAQAYRRFGSRVTVIQSGPQLMTREDPDVAAEMQRILSDEGIQILVAAEPLNVHGQSGKEVSVAVLTTSGEQKIEGSDILVAAGRIPNTAGIGLEKAGVE